MKKIVLIGFAACYKTTAGRILADKLNFSFVDTDQEIEQLHGMSIRQIFETQGEEYFRKKESELLSLLPKDNVVIACGGGSVLSPRFDEFVSDSIVIYLTASAQTVRARLDGATRPLFDGLTVKQLDSYMQARTTLYNKYGQQVISTDGKTAEQVAVEIVDLINV